MGLRYGKSIRLFPGLRVNFSRGGVSLSLGGAGSTTTINRTGVYQTVGVPGSGWSYRQKVLDWKQRQPSPAAQSPAPPSPALPGPAAANPTTGQGQSLLPVLRSIQ